MARCLLLLPSFKQDKAKMALTQSRDSAAFGPAVRISYMRPAMRRPYPAAPALRAENAAPLTCCPLRCEDSHGMPEVDAVGIADVQILLLAASQAAANPRTDPIASRASAACY